MNQESSSHRSADNMPELYKIHIQGILDPIWADWLECLQITHTASETILTSVIQDQCALHGLLAKIRDMNLKILSVNRVDPDSKNEKERHDR